MTAGALSFTSPHAVAASIKCWTNSEGVRECGNVVPPEYAQKGHEEVSEQGVTVDTQERAKTNEEIERERLDEERRKIQQKLEEAQQKRDRVLLATYATEDDMRLAHRGKIAAIDSRITHAEQLVNRLKRSLKDLVREAANQEIGGKDISKETLGNIKRVKRQILEQVFFIEAREEEKSQLNARFEDELARFKNLKAQ